MFKKILICLDGSHLAEQILPYAIEQATRFNARLLLLQVITVPSTAAVAAVPEAGVPTFTAPMIEEQIRAKESDAIAYLQGAAQQLRSKGLQVELAILQGVPGETIVRYAEKNEIDLIAIATHGHSGLGRLVFGSVADHVLRHSGLPVLVIKPKAIRA